MLCFGTWYYIVFVKPNMKDEDTAFTAISSSFSFSLLIKIILLGIFLQLFVDGILNGFEKAFPSFFEDYNELVSTVRVNDFIMILSVCLIAPIGEELLFRGVILHILHNKMPNIIACVLQAILFGIYHMNLIQGLYAFLIGIIFGMLTLHYKSIVPNIMLHMAINTSLFFIPGILFETIPVLVTTTVISGIGSTILLISLLGRKNMRLQG